MRDIGFIGAGIMGASMIRNLIKGGYRVSVYARRREKAEALVEHGAQVCESLARCVEQNDIVITIVGEPKDVEELYFGPDGILNHARRGSFVIDMTTSSPALAVRIYEAARQKGVHALDAPVTGGDKGAREGTLSILVGGEKAVYEACLPVFSAMGTNIHHEGLAGAGQHMKAVNQILLAGALCGVCEAITYADAKGLDRQKVLDSLAQGAGGSAQFTINAPKIFADDYAPGFFLKHFRKDLDIASGEAEEQSLQLSMVNYVRQVLQNLVEEGFGDLGTQAMILHYRKQAGGGSGGAND